MSRAEIYPWSLLTEVGDYFTVPEAFKPNSYVSAMVSQRNYRLQGLKRFVAAKTSYGTIVMLCQINEEMPPYEFMTPDGVTGSTSRQQLIMDAQVQDSELPMSNRPIRVKRTQSQIVAQMALQVKQENLPWWHDPRTGKLVTNPKLMQEPETSLWLKNQFAPGPDDPYPEHYNLGPDMMRRSREDMLSDVDDEEEDFGEHPIIGETDE